MRVDMEVVDNGLRGHRDNRNQGTSQNIRQVMIAAIESGGEHGDIQGDHGGKRLAHAAMGMDERR